MSVAFEIGELGTNGLEVNDPKAMIEIKSIGKSMSHLQTLCYMYAGFQLFEPSLDLKIDFKNEFEQAKKTV